MCFIVVPDRKHTYIKHKMPLDAIGRAHTLHAQPSINAPETWLAGLRGSRIPISKTEGNPEGHWILAFPTGFSYKKI